MKRYISSFVLILVLIGSIGTYYVTKVVAVSNLPRYEFKTTEGNEQELKPIILSGSYNRDSINESLTFEGNLLTYKSENSYVENLNGYSVEIEKLLKKYKPFLRGKHDPNSIYEDGDFLAYASVTNNYRNERNVATFEISLLEKKNKEELAFELNVPKQERIDYSEILDVQLIDSKLQVVTFNNMEVDHQNMREEIHVYTIDLANKKVINDEVIVSESTKNISVEIKYPTNTKSIGESHVFLYSVAKGNYSESGDFVPKETTVHKYDYETGKVETIKAPKKLINLDNAVFYDNSNLYFYEVRDQRIHLITFSLSDQTIIDEYSFDLVYDDFLFSIKNERMYLLGFKVHESQFDTYKPLQLLIADLKTGKTLYKGESMITSLKQQSKMNHGLSIHYLQVYEIN